MSFRLLGDCNAWAESLLCGDICPTLTIYCLVSWWVTSQTLVENVKIGGQCELNYLHPFPLAPRHRAPRPHMHVHSWVQVLVEELEVPTLDKWIIAQEEISACSCTLFGNPGIYEGMHLAALKALLDQLHCHQQMSLQPLVTNELFKKI